MSLRKIVNITILIMYHKYYYFLIYLVKVTNVYFFKVRMIFL
jgi:hypothetical protein